MRGHLRRGAPLAHGSRLVDAQIQDGLAGASAPWRRQARICVCKQALAVLQTPRGEAARLLSAPLCILFTHRAALPDGCCVERRRSLACGRHWLAESMPWRRLWDTSGVGHYDARCPSTCIQPASFLISAVFVAPRVPRQLRNAGRNGIGSREGCGAVTPWWSCLSIAAPCSE